MNLDSVRELKNICLEKHVKPSAVSPETIAAFGLRATSLKKVDPMQRSIALGIGRKNKQFHLAVRIQKRGMENSAEVEAIRRQAKGEVEVRYVGQVTKLAAWNQKKVRPLVIGISVGHFAITAGTLGCFVKLLKGKDKNPRILSNNHVLADENRGTKGAAILQPGHFDGGRKPASSVGTLEKFIRLKTSTSNFVDCAIAKISKTIGHEHANIRGVGTLSGTRNGPVDIGDEVHKLGRTTDATRGRVTAIELDNVVVQYDIGNLRFDNQIEIEGADAGPFSLGGDSGSLIVDGEIRAAALLFAGGDQGGTNGKGLTYGNPIAQVFAELGVELVF
jgi:hypothetical protein